MQKHVQKHVQKQIDWSDDGEPFFEDDPDSAEAHQLGDYLDLSDLKTSGEKTSGGKLSEDNRVLLKVPADCKKLHLLKFSTNLPLSMRISHDSLVPSWRAWPIPFLSKGICKKKNVQYHISEHGWVRFRDTRGYDCLITLMQAKSSRPRD